MQQQQLEAEVQRLKAELKETNSQGAMQQQQLETEVQRLTRELKDTNSQDAMQQQQLQAEVQRLTEELKETNSQGAMQQQQLEAEVQRMTTALAQANSQLAMLQTQEVEEEMHKLKAHLPATEAAARGQDAARASPADAASSMQQPTQSVSVRERELEAEVQKLKSQLEATAKLAQHPQEFALSHQIYAEFLEIDGFLTGLRAMGDKDLREAFKQFADICEESEEDAAKSTSGTQSCPESGSGSVSGSEASAMASGSDSAGESSSASGSESESESSSEEAATDDVSDTAANAEAKERAAAEAEAEKGCISKEGLAKMFETKNMTLSQVKLEEFMSRSDTDGNGKIDWHEFRALARSSSALEMMFKALPLERVLASCFGRGTADDPLEAFFGQQHGDVVAAALKAGHILVEMIVALIKKHNEARAKEHLGAGGAKYGAVLQGGTVDKFFEGVTGICGEPNPGVCGGGVVCVGGGACVCVCVCVCVCDTEHPSVT